MRKVRHKPGKPRDPGVRPERLAKIRNPELFKERDRMNEIREIISSKKAQLEEDYRLQSDIVRVLSRLSALVIATAQEAVNQANTVTEPAEKLAIINGGLISLVNAVANASSSSAQNALKFRFSSDLLDELLQEADPIAAEAEVEEGLEQEPQESEQEPQEPQEEDLEQPE